MLLPPDTSKVRLVGCRVSFFIELESPRERFSSRGIERRETVSLVTDHLVEIQSNRAIFPWKIEEGFEASSGRVAPTMFPVLSIEFPRPGESRTRWLTMGMGLLIQPPPRRRDPFGWKAHGHQPSTPNPFNADSSVKKTTVPLKAAEKSPLLLRAPPCV